MKTKLTPAQSRFIETCKRHECATGGSEYWPVVNSWLYDSARDGYVGNFAHRNMTRTVDALTSGGHITIDDSGMIHLI